MQNFCLGEYGRDAKANVRLPSVKGSQMSQPISNSKSKGQRDSGGKPRGKNKIRLDSRSLQAVQKADTENKRRRPSREKHPWGLIHEFYIAPKPTKDGAQITFSTYEEAAEKFGVPADQIRARGAKEGWVLEQKTAQDRWWTERNNALYQVIAQRLPQAQVGAFANALKGLELIRNELNALPDSATQARLMSANKIALETCLTAAAIDSRRGTGLPEITPFADYPRRVLITQEEKTSTIGDGGGSRHISQRRTLLEIFHEGRRLAAQLLPDEQAEPKSPLDDMDRPSPLAPRLSMVRK